MGPQLRQFQPNEFPPFESLGIDFFAALLYEKYPYIINFPSSNPGNFLFISQLY